MSYDLGSIVQPLLTADEEVALAQQIEQGVLARERADAGRPEPGDAEIIGVAERARHRFIEANMRLVISIAGRSKLPPHSDRNDAIQDGMVGLDRAVEKFDWRKGYKFSTYATWWIRQAIQRGMENTAATIRIPAHRASELNTTLASVGGDPSQLPPRLASIAALSNIDSIDRPLPDANQTLGDMVADDTSSPEDEAQANVDRGAIEALLSELDTSTARAIISRFGLDGGEPATYATIADQIGVSPEAARRRVVRALERLRPEAVRLVGADEFAVGVKDGEFAESTAGVTSNQGACDSVAA
jgi:RNA polymerase sigma factor (sigma-70 family)